MTPSVDEANTAAGIRRLDWRFLLPDANPRRAAYQGPERDSLASAMRERFPRLVQLNGRTLETFDLIVLQAPAAEGLEWAAERLAPGGMLFCELPLRRRGSILRRLPRLRNLGIGPAALHWHYPSFEECRWMVPLGAPAALASLLSRATRIPIWVARATATALTATGFLARAAPAVSLLLRRQEGTRPGPVKRIVGSSANDKALSYLLLTPRFRSSAHVISILVRADSGAPALVAKEARLPGACGTLAREAANLHAVQGARVSGFDSIPRLVDCRTNGDGCMLLETALGGQVVRASDVRADRMAIAEAVLSWVVDLHSATARRDLAAGEAFTSGVILPLTRLSAAWPRAAEMEDLISATIEVTRPLASLNLPTVACHGDLAAPNLLRGADGRLQVVDWELASSSGLPAEDLFFALAWLEIAHARAGRPPAQEAAFHRAFFVPGAWTQPFVRRYAEHLGIPLAALRPLFVACWARYFAARVERLRHAAGEPLEPQSIHWLRTDRFIRFWRHAVQHAGDIRFAESTI